MSTTWITPLQAWTSAEITVEGPPRILGVTRTEPFAPSTVIISMLRVSTAASTRFSASAAGTTEPRTCFWRRAVTVAFSASTFWRKVWSRAANAALVGAKTVRAPEEEASAGL